MATAKLNHLYYGDNIDILRNEIGSESVNLIYLDPPFNSQATYNVLFKAHSGEHSKAQVEAFEDTWHWNDVAEKAFDEALNSGNAEAAEMLRAMRSFLRESDMNGVSNNDGGAAFRTASRFEINWHALLALRRDG
jgi:site-specific DNA-methyltransferase (adenine-specific)